MTLLERHQRLRPLPFQHSFLAINNQFQKSCPPICTLGLVVGINWYQSCPTILEDRMREFTFVIILESKPRTESANRKLSHKEKMRKEFGGYW